MSSPHYASAAARVLRRASAATPPSAAANERGLETIQRALEARRRTQRLARVAAALMVAAVAALAVLGWRGLRASSVAQGNDTPEVSVSALKASGASIVDTAKHRETLLAGAEVAVGSRIETTAHGGAALRFSTGTELALDAKSWLTLQGRGPSQHFVLQAGGLQAKVAKLAVGARFVVQTPDAEVEVRGTRFHLSVLPQADTCATGRTRLAVQEGVVEVRYAGQAIQVRAGQHWPEACGTFESVGEALEPQKRRAEALDGRAAPSARRATVPPLASPAASAPQADAAQSSHSGLAAQTELFAEASRAARLGQVATALARYQELVRTYPSSALSENAVVERMRLLQGAAARREAARYLELYPRGFGKSEAKRILARP